MDVAKALDPVRYPEWGTASASFQSSRTSSFPHGEVVERIERAIESVGLWVLGKVDAQAFVGQGGYAIGGTLQILAFHPKFMVRLLEADPSALLGAPLKFAVIEMPDGSVKVSWADQAQAFQRYNNAALADLGHELAAICKSIVRDALGPE